MEGKTERGFFRVAGLCVDSVERKDNEVFVGGSRERRLNSSKIIVLTGADLQISVPVIFL